MGNGLSRAISAEISVLSYKVLADSADTLCMKHIDYLLQMEIETRGSAGGYIRFDRTGENTIAVSCTGYVHIDLILVEKVLRGLGCQYDFDKGVQDFDKLCGRTFTHFKEPANYGTE